MTAAIATASPGFASDVDLIGPLKSKISLLKQFGRSAVASTRNTVKRVSASLGESAKPMILGMVAGAGTQMVIKAAAAHFVAGAAATTLPAAATTLIVGAVAGGSAFAVKQTINTYFYNRTHAANERKSYRTEIFGREALTKMATSMVGGIIGAEWAANNPAFTAALHNAGQAAAMIGGAGMGVVRRVIDTASSTAIQNLMSKKGRTSLRESFFSKHAMLGAATSAVTGLAGLELLLHNEAVFGFMKHFNPISSAHAEEANVWFQNAKIIRQPNGFHSIDIDPKNVRLIQLQAMRSYHIPEELLPPSSVPVAPAAPAPIPLAANNARPFGAAQQADPNWKFVQEKPATITARDLPPPAASHVQVAATVARPPLLAQVTTNSSLSPVAGIPSHAPAAPAPIRLAAHDTRPFGAAQQWNQNWKFAPEQRGTVIERDLAPPTVNHTQVAATVTRPAVPAQAGRDSWHAPASPVQASAPGQLAATNQNIVGRDSWRAQPGDPEYVSLAKAVTARTAPVIEPLVVAGVTEDDLYDLKEKSFALIHKQHNRDDGMRVLREAVDAAKKQGLENTAIAKRLAGDLKFMETNPTYGIAIHNDNVVPIRPRLHSRMTALLFKKAA